MKRYVEGGRGREQGIVPERAESDSPRMFGQTSTEAKTVVQGSPVNSSRCPIGRQANPRESLIGRFG
jgi:hypothetical protein